MSGTNIPSSSKMAQKKYSAALFVQTAQEGGLFRNLTGPRPTMTENMLKVGKRQTSPGTPIVELFDLTKGKGDKLTLDCFDIRPGKPIMGSRNREGLGKPLSFDSMELSVNKFSFVVDAGDDLQQQRIEHDLRKIALSSVSRDHGLYFEQSNLVHMAGSRGHQQGRNWVLPLETAPDFAETLINPVLAPSRNRHYVVDGNDLINGGEQLANIDSTDQLKLAHLDTTRAIIDDMELGFQPVKYDNDLAKNDSPFWIAFTPSNVYKTLLTAGELRSFQANSVERANYGKLLDHPIFRGAVGMWNGILVVKLTRNVVRFLKGLNTKYVAAGDKYTAAESSIQINPGLADGYAVERTLIIGAQALANAYAKATPNTDGFYRWHERWYNAESNLEVTAEGMGGFTKIRFKAPEQGSLDLVPTDNGIIVIDSAVRIPG
jgi:hypothetical protein